MLCGRVTDLDTGYKYIISVVQTGGHGRCSYARTLVICQHCMRTHKTVMTLQRKSLNEENVLEFHRPPNPKNVHQENQREGLKDCRIYTSFYFKSWLPPPTEVGGGSQTGYAHKLPGEPKKWRIETIGMDDAESVEERTSVKMKALPDTSPNETLTPATHEGRF